MCVGNESLYIFSFASTFALFIWKTFREIVYQIQTSFQAGAIAVQGVQWKWMCLSHFCRRNFPWQPVFFFFCLCGGSDFHAILSGSQTNVESIFTLRWPSIKLSQPASRRLWSSSAYRIPGLPACACAGVHERSSLRQLIKIVAVCSRSQSKESGAKKCR